MNSLSAIQNANQARTTEQARQQLQDAARELRETFQQSGLAERAAAAAQGRAATGPTAPVAPITPGPDGQSIIIQPARPNAGQTYVSLPPFAYETSPKIPPQAVDISVAFFLTVAAIIIGLPLARAFARRMDRRGAAQIPTEVAGQLAHLSQAVDAIALEVERISEGQRFATRLLSEQREASHQTLPSRS